MRIVKDLTELVGNTPLIQLDRYCHRKKLKGTIIAKLESFNPLSSIKDRVGCALINDAEEKGKINSSTTLIEPTSGNTGVALAAFATIKGYRLILTMPESMSIERIKLLKQLGAEVVLTPKSDGMNGAINKARELNAEIKNSFILEQFSNPENVHIHKETTAKEIWRDTDGNIDIFVAGVGTGGTITGVGEYLKAMNPQIKVVAVEPTYSPILSHGKSGCHGIQGIGAGFIPKLLNTDIYDEVICVDDSQAIDTAKELALTEGLLVGISSGAALYASMQLALRAENEGKNIIVILPDSGERYLSTALFE